MGWEIGYDEFRERFVGYGVPAYCEHPDCGEEINRGLAFVCGGEPYGGVRGCGLFFCYKHLIIHARLPQLCERCNKRKSPFEKKHEHPDWVKHILTDESWKEWRETHKEEVLNFVLTYCQSGTTRLCPIERMDGLE